MIGRQGDKRSKKQFRKIVKEILRNSEKGFSMFYETYGKLIQSATHVICRSIDKANEVVNSVLIKIWQNVDTLKTIENPEGWIYVITVNTAKDLMRGRYIFPLEENIVADKDQTEEIFDKESFYWMIEDLFEIEQNIMVYKFVLRFTFQEIADELNKPLTTVTSIYYRALKKVKIDFVEKN